MEHHGRVVPRRGTHGVGRSGSGGRGFCAGRRQAGAFRVRWLLSVGGRTTERPADFLFQPGARCGDAAAAELRRAAAARCGPAARIRGTPRAAAAGSAGETAGNRAGRGEAHGAAAAGLRARLGGRPVGGPRSVVSRRTRLPGARRRGGAGGGGEAAGTGAKGRFVSRGRVVATHSAIAAHRPGTDPRQLACGGGRESLSQSRCGACRGELGDRLVRAARRSGLRRRHRDPAAVAGGVAAGRFDGGSGGRHLRIAAGRVAGAVRAPGRAGHERGRPSALPPQPGGSVGRPAGGPAGRTRGRAFRAHAGTDAPLSGHPRGGAAGRIRGAIARLPAGRPGMDGVPARIRFRRLPGGRHGSGQDRAGAGAAGDAESAGQAGRRWWWCRSR